MRAVLPSRRCDARIPVGAGEVHVWRSELDASSSTTAECLRLLSEDERRRADRFRFDVHSRAFIVARGRLRQLVSRYVGIDAGRLQFEYGPYGKPSLAAGARGLERLEFNVSHSGRLALYAVTRGRRVGVDVELVAPEVPTDELAARCFSPVERDALAAVPAALRRDAFFACWTRKEAYLKGRGDGLSVPLERITATFAPGAPLDSTAQRPAHNDASPWTIREVHAAPGYAAAIAVEGAECEITYVDDLVSTKS